MGREPDIFEQVRAAGLITGLTIILVLLASGRDQYPRRDPPRGPPGPVPPTHRAALDHAIAQAAQRRALGESSPAAEEDDAAEPG